MIGLRIGAAELAEIEAGAPCVVLAGGATPPDAPPLVPLVLANGVLARSGGGTHAVPVPPGFRPLGIFGPADAAAALRPWLPAGLPVFDSAAALLGPLAAALQAAEGARAAAVQERDRLRRAMATAPAHPRVVLEVSPGAGTPAAPPATQPLGRAGEGICTVEIHLAAAGTGPLRARLVAGGKLLGAWHMPSAALAPGWLALDLPEPAPPGPEEAVLELVGEAGPILSPGAEGSVALRIWSAPQGWSVLPRYFDWAATGLRALPAGIPLPLPDSVLAGATVEGARLDAVAAGSERARLLLAVPPGGEAALRLPPVAPGPADLLRLTLVRREGAGRAELRVTVTGSEEIASAPRATEEDREISVALPLPPGPRLDVAVMLREIAGAPLVLEVARLALMSGAAGEMRPVPAPSDEGRPGHAVRLPRPALAARLGPPAPRMPLADPGQALDPEALPLAAPMAMPPAGASIGEVRLHQHLTNTDGSYRHLDISAASLVSGGGLWRQLRTKLFERRGVVGLEFRDLKGWPPMFDAWPGKRSDGYGPFWRIETEATGTALAELATAHDRAFLAALLEVLPDLASRAAADAALPPDDVAAWRERGRIVADAVANARARG